jgi:Tfp pilus assembly protein PilX
MTRRLRHEEGWVLVTAMGLMAIMLSVILVTMNYVDTQTKQSSITRTRETAFNVAEAALNAQTFALAKEWPGVGKANDPYPTCTQVSTSPRCPAAANMQSLFTSADARTGVTWTTQVRDNNVSGSASFYSDTLTATSPGYDSNGDGRVWVRAQATARGRTRTLVALVGVEEIFEDLPKAAIIAGRLQISDMGNKVLVDGTHGTLPTVAVRCEPQSVETVPCLGHAIDGSGIKNRTQLESSLNKQLSPPKYTSSFTGGDATTQEVRDRLRNTAIANGSYYATCPPTIPTGNISWIESGNCSYSSNTVINSAASPGILIVNNGSINLDGSMVFYGVIYGVNSQRTTGVVVELEGNVQVIGGILIDANGELIAGSSKTNVTLDDVSWTKAKSYAAAGMIQNTWREIRNAQ